jgi:hypothetical protein
VNASEFGSTHKRDAGGDVQSGTTAIVSEITSSSVSVPVASTEKVSPSKEELTPVVSMISSAIPSMVTITKEEQDALAAFVSSPKKYNITKMPEATCDGCQ